jgi:hypothetical protein
VRYNFKGTLEGDSGSVNLPRMVRSDRIVRRCSSSDNRIQDCGSEVLDVVLHPEPERAYPADPPKCTVALKYWT